MATWKKIVYWFSNLWLALGMASTAAGQVMHVKSEDDFTTHMAYPDYFLTLLGVWKLLGVIAILLPRFPLLKEWAYAGFCFAMTGAVYSHIAIGEAGKIFPAMLLLALTLLSWYFRPADRRLGTSQP